MQKQKKILALLAGKLASRFVALLIVALCALVPAGGSAASASAPAAAALAQRLDAM